MFFPEATAAATVIVTALDRQTAAIDRLTSTLVPEVSNGRRGQCLCVGAGKVTR